MGDNGTILTSTDGRTWSAHDSGTFEPLYGVAWSGSQFVAVGGSTSGGGTILTSTDGRTWSAHDSGTLAHLYGAASSGSQFVVVGDNGTILTSS